MYRDTSFDTLALIIFVLGVVIAAGIGYWIAGEKNRDRAEGAALGCFLGPIGWIIEAVLPTGEPPLDSPTGRANSGTPLAHASKPPAAPTPVSTVLYVPHAFVLDPEGSRKPHGPDGPPPGSLKFDEKTGSANLIAAMARAELHYFKERGYRVVEAVWKPGIKPTVLAAYGEPSKTYDLMWPTYPRVNWTSLVGEDIAPEPDHAATAVPDLMVTEPSANASDPSGHQASQGSPVSSASAASVRPTKSCPDCAEMVLEAARICRYCRYEFRPADVALPTTPSDVPAVAAVMPSPEAPTPPDEPETQIAAMDAATEPTEPETDAAQQDEPPQPDPLVAEPPPPTPEPEAWSEQREPIPPALPPPPHAPPTPAWVPPAPPPSYPPQRPPYAPPPPGWQPPQGPPPGQVPPGQGPGPWPPPPDRPRQ